MAENNEPVLPGLGVPEGMTDDDWYAKEVEILELFSPTHPVKEIDLFSGRKDQMRRITEAIMQVGQHGILYGDRGVGKTSLINTVCGKLYGNSRYTKILPVQCYDGDDFADIWERVFKSHTWNDGSHAFDDIDDALSPDSLFEVISKFGGTQRPVFIFDEFDRITDPQTKLKMAETIKLFSDKSEEATIIIVGVGRTIQDLLAGHESVSRALKQIEMPRMSAEECRAIVRARLPRVGVTIDDGLLETIVWLGRGMPGFVHLLGMQSALAAVRNHKLHIGNGEFGRALKLSLGEVAESTRHAYAKAVQSAQPNNLLRQSLLACAVATPDEFGTFAAASVRKPLSDILGKERDIPDFSRHLGMFCDENHGPILHREGRHKNYRYRFIDPLMQSYVITKGLDDGLLPTKIAG